MARLRALLGPPDWRTGLLAGLLSAAVFQMLFGLQLSRMGQLDVVPSTMVLVTAVWVAGIAWCLVRRRLTEGESMTIICSVATLTALEAFLIPDTTWQWVCASALFVMPAAGVMFLRRSLLVALTVWVVLGQAAVAVARNQPPLLALCALSAVVLCTLIPVVVVSVLSTALQAARANAEQLARTDALTGLLNRHGMGEAAAAVVAGAVRHGRALGVLVADVDWFKRVNDTWGHAVGDQVLVACADTLRRHVREGDLVVRLGGEEVAVVGAWKDDDDVAAAAERLRAAVEQQTTHGLPSITVSIGTSSVPARDLSPSSASDVLSRLIDRADQALYEAKRAGRNCVRHSSGAAGAPSQRGAPGPRIGA